MISRIRRISILTLAGAIAMASAPAIGDTITWVGNGDAVSWGDVNNWDLVRTPLDDDDVVIPDVAVTTSVTYASGTVHINSLSCDEPLDVTGGDLGVVTAGIASVTQPVTLNGGTCSGGTWKCSGSGAIVGTNNGSNYLSGVTLEGEISLSDNSARIHIVDGTTFTTAYLDGYGNALQFAPGSVITGDIIIRGTQGAQQFIEMSGGNGIVTIADTGSIQIVPVNNIFGAHIGWPYYSSGHMTLINQGLIRCEHVSANNAIQPPDGFTNEATGTVEVANGGLLSVLTSWTNLGQMTALGGATLRLQGTTRTADIGSIDGSGGTIRLFQCSIDNTNDTLLLDSSRATWVFESATISEGTIDFADGMVMNIGAGTTQLLNVIVNGEILLGQNQAHVRIEGSTTFASARVNTYYADLQLDPGTIVSGDVWFGGSDSGPRFVEILGNGSPVTIAPTSTFQFDSPNGASQAWINCAGNTTLVNQGTIRANVAGAPIRIQTSVAGDFTNDGVIEAMNGGAVWVHETTNYDDFTNTLEGGSWYVESSSLIRIDDASIIRNAADIVLDGAGSQFSDDSDVDLLAGFAENYADGSFTITNGRDLTTSGPFTNEGALVASGGSTFTATGNYAQTDGITTIDGGTLASTTLVNIQGGILAGNGLVDAPIVNAGSVSPGLSAGMLSGTATFTQTTAGGLDIQIGGQVSNDDYDVLAVDGAATLAGALNVTLINGFEPPVGSSYDILTASSISGTFDTENLPTLVNDHCWDVGYQADKVTLTILSPSVITTQPVSAVVCEGDPVTFSVGADGYPSPTYQWYHDGNPVPGETGSSMTIDETTTGDAGPYTVLVSNDCGNDTSVPVTLGVQTNPVVTVQPQSQTVCEGDSVTFNVTVTGDPPPDFQWRKDGTNIDLATDASLTIDPVATDDFGSYDVVVTNACDTVTSAPATLTVHTAPVITVAPQSQTVCEGDPVTFSVTATGDPVPTYQWQYEGSDIPDATGTSLTIPSTTTDDEGDYTVVVTNECGAPTSSPAMLTINTAPVITVQPQSQTVCEGDQVTFNVSVTGIPAPTYQWKVNGTPIGGATDASLTVASVSVADDGAMYSVEVENECGTATSDAATLTVQTAPVITLQPESETVCAGDEVTLVVTAIGNPPPLFQWQLDGEDIPNETGDSLTFDSVSVENTGNYSVEARNICGTILSVEVPLTVHTAPLITLQPQSQTVCAGDPVTFSVMVTGDPPPTYQWKKNDVNIGGATDASLTIDPVTPGDAATYSVEVMNECGQETSSDAVLTVHTAPVVTVAPQSQTVCEGDPVTFSVTATGDPAPTYQWQLNGTDIPDETGTSLTIPSVTPADAGGYGVVVTNECGAPTPVATLTVHTAPVITHISVTTAICEGDSTSIRVGATGDPEPTYQWRFNGENIPGATGDELTISNATTDDAGDYDVVVSNECGDVSSGARHLDVYTAPVITASPQSQTVCEGDPVTFSVTATGDPAPTYQWQYEGSDIPNETGTSYTIPSVLLANAGEYGVVVSNACGTPAPVATLTVHTAPVITSIGEYPDTVCEGESVTLSVTVTGDPAPTYQWKLDDAVIPGATSDSLTIEHAMTSDAGAYTVEVTNACGNAVSDPMPLTVHTMPEITVQPQSQTVCEGDSVTFAVTATSDTAQTYQWYHDGVDIMDATDASFTIDPVSAPDNAGEYYVEVTNACGPESSTVAVLTVRTLPVVTVDPVSQGACEGGAVTFSVSATGDPAPTYQWRHGGADIGGATDALLTIDPLTMSDAGAYNVVVSNVCGSDTSAFAMLTVFETHSGDVNGDSKVDGADIQMFVGEIMNPGEPSAVFCAADMDLSGTLDEDDVVLFVSALLGG